MQVPVVALEAPDHLEKVTPRCTVRGKKCRQASWSRARAHHAGDGRAVRLGDPIKGGDEEGELNRRGAGRDANRVPAAMCAGCDQVPQSWVPPLGVEPRANSPGELLIASTPAC